MSVDDLVLSDKFNIEALIRQASARASEAASATEAEGEVDGLPSLDRLSPLPRPGDPYKAFSRPSSKELPTLSLLKADGTVWSYPYSCRVEGPHLVPANDAAKNLVVVLKFTGLSGIEIMIGGQRLELMTNYLAYHRVAWIREHPKGRLIQEIDAPLVTSISVKGLED